MGVFEKPLASALSRVQRAQNSHVAKQAEAALEEAKAAVALAPNAVQPQMMLGDVLEAMGQPEGARSAYQKAFGTCEDGRAGIPGTLDSQHRTEAS